MPEINFQVFCLHTRIYIFPQCHKILCLRPVLLKKVLHKLDFIYLLYFSIQQKKSLVCCLAWNSMQSFLPSEPLRIGWQVNYQPGPIYSKVWMNENKKYLFMSSNTEGIN